MIIGVPRERKTLERRVAITPNGARELTNRGHTVMIEQRAGEGSYFSDEEYRQAGCTVVSTLAEVWKRAELLVKVKEPHEEEYQFFRPELTIFDYLHLASMPELARIMVETKVVGIAYELVQTPDQRLPLLEPMSEVAGKLSVINGASALLSQNGGRGVLLGGAVGVPPAQVGIIGAGIAGRAACEMAVGMGAAVTVLELDQHKLDALKAAHGTRVEALTSSQATLAKVCAQSDLLIGAVLVPGAAAPRIVSRALVKTMRRGAVIVDISIDQGGCVETIRPTSLDKPVYEEEGVIHYGVCNMPAQTPLTSTLALTAATLPYIVQFAERGIAGALQLPEIRGALNTWHGALTNRAVSEAVKIPFTPIERALVG